MSIYFTILAKEKYSADLYYLETDAVLLALCGRVRVVTTKHQTVAGEPAVLERNFVSLKRGMMGWVLTCVVAMIG